MELRDRLGRIRSRVAELLARLRVYLDARAEKEKAAWGSSMEYKRRYTNPDAAKKARTPPPKRNES
jgi:hypothetical protein